MAGLGPAIHVLLGDGVEEIVPCWIVSGDQSDFPRARPMLDVVLALNGSSNVIEHLEVDEPLKAVPFGEPLNHSRTMLEHAPNEVARYADIQGTVRTIGHDVNVPTCHADIPQDVDGRDKPGHDGGEIGSLS
jgi:hypothetical protein